MTPPGILDTSGESTQAAAEAQVLLAAGDTRRAADFFKTAAKALESRIPAVRRQSDKHLLRFLAASQYYHGGMYHRENLCRKIDARLLPAETRPLFENFVRDVRDRSASDYRSRTKRALGRALHNNDFQKVLTLLQDQPYLLPPAKMAFFRAICCKRLGDLRAATVFFEDGLKFDPKYEDLVHAAGYNALVLARERPLADAWAHIRRQLDATDHAFPKLIASLIRCFQARITAPEAEKRALLREQLAYFEQGWNLYQLLPAKQQGDPETRKLIELALEAAALGAWRLGDESGARKLAERFIEFAPTAYGPRTVRGMINYPSDKALQDFRAAIERGDPHYQPYYYLAHAALTRGEFASAPTWSEEALRRGPSNAVKAQLLEWLAIAHSYLGQDPKEIERLFVQAQELDPENARIRHNAAIFQSASAAPTTIPNQSWDWGDVQNGRDQYATIVERDQQLLSVGEPVWSGERELLGV